VELPPLSQEEAPQVPGRRHERAHSPAWIRSHLAIAHVVR